MWQSLSDQITMREWDKFVAKHGPASGRFLQSFEWGEFVGGQRLVLGGEGNSRITGVATVIYKSIPGLGKYAYCPRGPVVNGDIKHTSSELAGRLDNVLFLRFDPPVRVDEAVSWDPAYCVHTIPIQPPMTRITDLSVSEDQLFASCHSKLRYNIRLAEKNNVTVRFDMNDLEQVWHLFESTSGRGKFRLHDKEYYARMLTVLERGSCHAFLATAWFENKPVVANIMIDFADTRTYLHGASSYEHRFLMAPHLLHWELMRDAKAKGLSIYDWWGVSPESQPDHPWAGVSRFKRAFPGRDVSFVGTYDLVKRPIRYRVYKLARALRRLEN